MPTLHRSAFRPYRQRTTSGAITMRVPAFRKHNAVSSLSARPEETRACVCVCAHEVGRDACVGALPVFDFRCRYDACACRKRDMQGRQWDALVAGAFLLRWRRHRQPPALQPALEQAPSSQGAPRGRRCCRRRWHRCPCCCHRRRRCRCSCHRCRAPARCLMTSPGRQNTEIPKSTAFRGLSSAWVANMNCRQAGR